MINEEYHESILLSNATSKTKNGRKLEYDYLYKIPSNRDGVFEDFKELIHEHLFEVIRVLPLDHNCNGELINKCVTCDAIYCNHCGRRISPKGFINLRLNIGC